MANVLGFKDIMILTTVSHVAINFVKPEQHELKQITVS
jgi:carbamate kinase